MSMYICTNKCSTVIQNCLTNDSNRHRCIYDPLLLIETERITDTKFNETLAELSLEQQDLVGI